MYLISVGEVIEEIIHQSEQLFLDDDLRITRFVLTFIVFPKSACRIFLHQEYELNF